MLILVVLASTLFTALYFFRVGEQVFFKASTVSEKEALPALRPANWQLIFPMGVLAVVTLLLGLFANPLIRLVLIDILPVGI